jgi:16S rRNA (uracil1498-N3)-methyltransferase
VILRVGAVAEPAAGQVLIVAAAIPKGDRADWMVEKLSELGVARFIPLITHRSVVHPKGHNKRERWQRIATESAKQSRRSGVMEIADVATLEGVLTVKDEGGWMKDEAPGEGARFYLSPTGASLTTSFVARASSLLLIGPEGGFTDDELRLMDDLGLTGVKLTGTILRVETAAVAAAAVVACLQQQSTNLS